MMTSSVKKLFKKMSPDYKGLVKDSIWTFGSSAVTSGLYLVEVMILARLLPKEQLGIYFLIISYPELILLILDMKIKDIMVKYLSHFLSRNQREHANALIKLLWLLSVAIALAAFCIVYTTSTPVSGILTGNPSHGELMIFFSIGLVFEAFDGATGSILRILNRFDLAFWTALIIGISRLGIISLVLLFSSNLQWLITGRVIVSVLSTICLLWVSLFQFNKRIGLNCHAPLSLLYDYQNEIKKFIYHVNISSTLKLIVTKIDIMLVGAILNTTAVAVYKISTQLAKTILLFTDSLSVAIFPRFSNLYARGEMERIKTISLHVTKIVFLFSLFISCFIFFFRDNIVSKFAGAEFTSDTTPFLIASFSIAVSLPLFWTRAYMLSHGLVSKQTKSIFIGSILGLVGIVILTHLYRETGATVGFGLFYIGTSLTQIVQIVKFNKKASFAISS